LRGKVLLPLLGDELDSVLRTGDLQITGEPAPAVHYFDRRFPIAEGSVTATDGATVDRVNKSARELWKLLEAQHYRLEYWKTGLRRVNYRRFFDVAALAGVRVEEPDVFTATHRQILRWVNEGAVDGLRVDHPDGLADPEAYLKRLRAASPHTWILAEKILQPGETLPGTWPIQGTSGYDFLARINSLFVNPAGRRAIGRVFAGFTGITGGWEETVHEARRQVLRDLFEADLSYLAMRLRQAAGTGPPKAVRQALVDVIAEIPRYRTYIRPAFGEVAAEDAACVAGALGRAREAGHATRILDAIRDVLLLRTRGEAAASFVTRFQQVCAAAMAKGVEDTSFYRYFPLVSLNEVGSDPGRFGTAPVSFHRMARRTQERWPLTMLTTSTHDTKRGEDARIRIDLLSEIPGEWGATLERWSRLAGRHRRGEAPDRPTEYLLYQALVGGWPADAGRVSEFLRKAMREAKVHTSWLAPNERYEGAVLEFAAAILGDEGFVADVGAFVDRLAAAARVSSLAQLLVKLTAPGVPDIYQGSELWDHSFVDPDNRRPVDYGLRREVLEQVRCFDAESAWRDADRGTAKLWLIRRGLACRRAHPEAYGPKGDYQPVFARGRKARHVVAFARGAKVITIVPRLVLGLGDDWDDTRLPLGGGTWVDYLTGERWSGQELAVAEIFARFPVSLLVRQDTR
jgi:(1->4)-alpha-D-glucan 1-alpha-D-glucosylmutase